MLPGTIHIVFTEAGNHVLKVEMQQLVKMKSKYDVDFHIGDGYMSIIILSI